MSGWRVRRDTSFPRWQLLAPEAAWDGKFMVPLYSLDDVHAVRALLDEVEGQLVTDGDEVEVVPGRQLPRAAMRDELWGQPGNRRLIDVEGWPRAAEGECI